MIGINSTLGEICQKNGGLIQTGPFGSQLHQSDYTETGVPVVMPKDIVDGKISVDCVARIPETKAQQLSRHLLRQNSIVLPRRGDISKRAYIKEDQAGFFCGSGCLQIITPDHLLDARYLYYYLAQDQVVEWLERNAIGTTMLNLSMKIVENIPFCLIPLITQKKIASILSNYDDLIENNRRRIQLLERSLHLLYKEWFVHLRFPSHEHSKIVDGIPEGWERKPLGSFVTLNYGKSLQSDKRVSGNYPVYGSSGIIGTHTEPLVKGHGIIVGRKGNVGKVFWADSDYFPIDTVYFISPESSNFFLFYALLSTQFTSTDVAVPGLNRNFAHSVNILIPDKKLLEIFQDLAKPIRKQISTLNKQNESLGKARDLLLPKLMSGAISV